MLSEILLHITSCHTMSDFGQTSFFVVKRRLFVENYISFNHRWVVCLHKPSWNHLWTAIIIYTVVWMLRAVTGSVNNEGNVSSLNMHSVPCPEGGAVLPCLVDLEGQECWGCSRSLQGSQQEGPVSVLPPHNPTPHLGKACSFQD